MHPAIMSDSGSPGGPYSLPNRTPSPAYHSRDPSLQLNGLQDVDLEPMDPARPGRVVNINERSRSNSEERMIDPEDPNHSPQAPRWKTRVRVAARPLRDYTKMAIQLAKTKGDKKVGWKRTTFVLLTEQVGLALGLAPHVFARLGLYWGVVTYCSVAAIAFFTNIVLWRLKLEHPRITSICDMGEKLFGRFGMFATLILFGLCSIVSIYKYLLGHQLK